MTADTAPRHPSPNETAAIEQHVAEFFKLKKKCEALEARLRAAEAALEWMASFSDSDLANARTLHFDMCGKAKEVLAAANGTNLKVTP